MKAITPERLAVRLIQCYPDYAKGLYNVIEDFHRTLEGNPQNSDFEAFWNNEYVKKYMALEMRFQNHGIEIASSEYCSPSGLAVNIGVIYRKIGDYLKE